ncbi:MAG: HAD family phosphatase, partial [Oscillospiraceae bacterium]
MPEINLHGKTKALIFDCDGTLVDSMPVHTEAWKIAITANGGKFDFDFFDSVKGMKSGDIIVLYNETFGTDLIPSEVIKIKHKIFKEKLYLIQPIEPVVKVARDNYKKMPMAVVSGGSKKNVIAELEHTGIIDLFDLILTADDDFKPKPAPDLFLQAAKVLNIN